MRIKTRVRAGELSTSPDVPGDREPSLVVDILKTKHDTVKNSISNVR